MKNIKNTRYLGERQRPLFKPLFNFLMVYIILNHKIVSYCEIYAVGGIMALCNYIPILHASNLLLSTMDLEGLRIYSVIPTDNLYKERKI